MQIERFPPPVTVSCRVVMSASVRTHAREPSLWRFHALSMKSDASSRSWACAGAGTDKLVYALSRRLLDVSVHMPLRESRSSTSLCTGISGCVGSHAPHLGLAGSRPHHDRRFLFCIDSNGNVYLNLDVTTDCRALRVSSWLPLVHVQIASRVHFQKLGDRFMRSAKPFTSLKSPGSPHFAQPMSLHGIAPRRRPTYLARPFSNGALVSSKAMPSVETIYIVRCAGI
jgi:hypothetical protein